MVGVGHVFSKVLYVVCLRFIMTDEDVAWGTEGFPRVSPGSTHPSFAYSDFHIGNVLGH
jgi:hypothetical protein